MPMKLSELCRTSGNTYLLSCPCQPLPPSRKLVEPPTMCPLISVCEIKPGLLRIGWRSRSDEGDRDGPGVTIAR